MPEWTMRPGDSLEVSPAFEQDDGYAIVMGVPTAADWVRVPSEVADKIDGLEPRQKIQIQLVTRHCFLCPRCNLESVMRVFNFVDYPRLKVVECHGCQNYLWMEVPECSEIC